MKKYLLALLLLAPALFGATTYRPGYPMQNADNGLFHYGFSGAAMAQVDSAKVLIRLIHGSGSNGIRILKTSNAGTSWSMDTLLAQIYRVGLRDVGDSAFVYGQVGSQTIQNPPFTLYKYGPTLTLSNRDSIGLSASVYDSGSGSNPMPNIIVLADSLFGVSRFNGGSIKSFTTAGEFGASQVFTKLVTDTNNTSLGITASADTGCIVIVTDAAQNWQTYYYGPNGWDTLSTNLLGGAGQGTGRNYQSIHAYPAKGSYLSRRLFIAAQRPNGTSGTQTVTFYRVDITGNVGAKSATKTDSVVIETGSAIKVPIAQDTACYTFANPRVITVPGTDTLFVIYSKYSDTSNATGSAKSLGYKMSQDGGATFGAWVELKAASNSRIQHVQVSPRMDKCSDGKAYMWMSYTLRSNTANDDTLEVLRQEFTWSGASPATIVTSADTLMFVADSGGSNPAGQNLTITNSGGTALDFTLSDDSTWLEMTPTTGTDDEVIAVSIDNTNLDPGIYWEELVITDAAATNSPYTVYVKYTVNDVSNDGRVAKYVPVNRFR